MTSIVRTHKKGRRETQYRDIHQESAPKEANSSDAETKKEFIIETELRKRNLQHQSLKLIPVPSKTIERRRKAEVIVHHKGI